MTTRLGSGQTALVTGASGGIGLDLAECFAKDGYDLVLAARTQGTLKQQAERLTQMRGVKAVPIAIDLQVQGAGRGGRAVEVGPEAGRVDRLGRGGTGGPADQQQTQEREEPCSGHPEA